MTNIFKNRRNNRSIEEKKTVNDNRAKNYAPSQKIDEFIEWYYINFVKGHFTDIGEQHQPDHMRNIIEKMAVWYELRYPEYEVSRLYPGSTHEDIFTDNIYLYKNAAIRKITKAFGHNHLNIQ